MLALQASQESLHDSEASLLQGKHPYPCGLHNWCISFHQPSASRGFSAESPHVHKWANMAGECGCWPSPGSILPGVFCPTPTDDSGAAPKSPWGINIIKKNKKAAPRAFGVRLEECQPATENQVGLRHTAKQAPEGDRQNCKGLWKQLSPSSYRHSWGSPERERQNWGRALSP